jgi:MOSC domain-containing protein YiiM
LGANEAGQGAGLLSVTPRVISVNVGLPRTVIWAGRPVTSGIWKEPVNGRVVVEGINLHGDDQADRRVHGGRDKAVYAYSTEDYAWWADVLGRDLGAGTFGENLTTEGIELSTCVIGQEWQVGTTVLQVAQPREPCFKLGMRMGDAEFVELFGSSGRSGTYLRIQQPGDIGPGDPIVTRHPPSHGLTVGDLVAVRPNAPTPLLERIAAINDVPEDWRIMAKRRLARLHDNTRRASD